MELALRLIISKGAITPELTEAMLGAVAPEIMENVRQVAQANSVAPVPPEIQQLLTGQAPAAPGEAPAEPGAAPAPETPETPATPPTPAAPPGLAEPTV